LVILVVGFIALHAVLTAIFAAPFLGVSPWYAVFSVLAFSLIIICIDLVVTFLLRILPLKIYASSKRAMRPKKHERKFFRRIGIKRWKIIVPDILSILKIFDKSKLKNTDNPDYMFKFLCEMGWAEMVHIVAFFAGFLAIFVPIGWLFTGYLNTSTITGEYIILTISQVLIFVLPLAILNAFVNLLPVCVQRYNRPVIIKLYQRALRLKGKIRT